MATTASASATPYVVPHPNDVSYSRRAFTGGIITAVATVIDPIWGATAGTYCVINILSQVALDKLGIDELGTIGKVAKTVIAFFLSVGAAAGVATALGVTITVTPALTGFFIGWGAYRILIVISQDVNSTNP